MRIREMMERAGVSMTQLADRLGVAVPSVSNWCSGRCLPSSKNLPRIADVLHCSIDELFGRGV